MKRITPREFRNAFVDVLTSDYHSVRTAAGFEAKSYKYFMQSNIFPKVAKQLGLSFWKKEYYALDCMFYEERGLDNRGNHSSYAKWISIALEHATQSAKTHEEINKLQSVNAPLKVLITYATEGPETDTLLQRYESVINDSDVFNDVATLRQQLVIFGTPRSAHEWRIYVYENSGFVLMLPH